MLSPLRLAVVAGLSGLATITQALPLAAPPAERPQRIILTLSGDPATELAVSWRRPVENPDQLRKFQPRTMVIEAPHGPQLQEKNARIFPAQITPVPGVLSSDTSPTQATYHYFTSRLTDLTPNTKYAYRVGSEEAWSEWNHFTTAHATTNTASVPQPFHFLYFGDAQNDILSQYSRVVRDAFRAAPNAAFMLFAGDLVDRGADDFEWAEWFESKGFFPRTMPVIATPGNHEYVRNILGRRRGLTPLWEPQFEYPKNGIQGLEDTNYFIDYQGVRLISLNSNEKIEEQAAWLQKTLADTQARWTIFFFHHPVYSTASRRDNPEIRRAWLPIIDEHRVDLVLQGHDHTYGRTDRTTSGALIHQNQPGGTVFVVSVAGPKMYNIASASAEKMPRRAEDTQLYQIVSITQNTLIFEAYTAKGDLYDGFTLTKTSEGNLLTTPPTPPIPQRFRQSSE
jgi:hypothetical protein